MSWGRLCKFSPEALAGRLPALVNNTRKMNILLASGGKDSVFQFSSLVILRQEITGVSRNICISLKVLSVGPRILDFQEPFSSFTPGLFNTGLIIFST